MVYFTFRRLFHDNYGLAIIVIVLIVRFILLPLMLIQVKNMHMMREKQKVVKPELDAIREKLKMLIHKKNVTRKPITNEKI